MNRRLIFALVISLLLLNLAVGAKIYFDSPRAVGARDNAQAGTELFNDVLRKVRAEYVDGKDITYQKLVHSALKGMVSQLDPHSEFMDAESFQQLQDDTEGQFGGLGLMVALRDGYITVIAPVEDSPGSRAGILTGDRIVKVDGKSVEKMSLSEVVKMMRGEPGSSVVVTIDRPTTGATKTFSLKRAIIQMDMVRDIAGKKEFPLDGDKIGYVRLTQFGDKTADEFETALNRLKRQGMKGLILDLRWNPGGLLDQAVEVCEKFLPRGSLVVSTEGRREVKKYFAKGGGDEIKGVPIVILVNLGSASASEIVAGCLQDTRRAVLLGEKTFGKGSVQTVFPLEDNTALKLTVAKYYTPSHKVIHQHGITPDILVPLSDAEEAALILKREPGGLEALPPVDRPKVAAFRDEQLSRARDVLKSLIIYGTLNNTAAK